MNSIHLIGRLGGDPEPHAYGEREAKRLARFSLAVERPFDRDGDPDWIPVVVFDGPHQRFAERHLSKGDLVAVEGRLEHRKWETEDGEKRASLTVTASSIRGLSGPRGETHADMGAAS